MPDTKSEFIKKTDEIMEDVVAMMKQEREYLLDHGIICPETDPDTYGEYGYVKNFFCALANEIQRQYGTSPTCPSHKKNKKNIDKLSANM